MTPQAPVSVAWSYPGFFSNNQTFFPTYLDRIYAPAPVPNLDFQFVLACAALTNKTAAAQSVDVSVAMPSYATVNQGTVMVPASGSASLCVDPVFDFNALDGVSTLTPSTLQVSAAISGGGPVLGSSSYPFEIVESNGIDWQTQGSLTLANMGELTAVFVRPNDPTVTQVRSAAEKLSMFEGGFGTRPFTHTIVHDASFTPAVSDWDTTYMEVGETLTVMIDSVSGGSGDASYFLLNSTEYSAWVACSYCGGIAAQASSGGAVTGGSWSFTATSGDWYYVVVQNIDGSNSQTIEWSRSSTFFDSAFDVAQATFFALRADGISYSNISSSDLSGIQDIRPPAEVIQNQAGNCIEGSLLFASVAEQVGFEPQMNYFQDCTDGLAHAIFAVRTPGAQLFWPVETTDVGSSSVTPWDAVTSSYCVAGTPCEGAIATVNNHQSCDNTFDVSTARTDNISPGQ